LLQKPESRKRNISKVNGNYIIFEIYVVVVTAAAVAVLVVVLVVAVAVAVAVGWR
jgi:hypothetical protein